MVRLVILLVRMWVEISHVDYCPSHRHSHPPREDVSWNIGRGIPNEMNTVILLVRMWVEILPCQFFPLLFCVILLVRMWVEMLEGAAAQRERMRHPPREDVSWNNNRPKGGKVVAVILLVRMWVEMACTQCLCPYTTGHPPREDVSWNICDCRTWCRGFCHPPREDVSWNTVVFRLLNNPVVILLVRMWVEILVMSRLIGVVSSHPPREDVSWNISAMFPGRTNSSHPPREDVSWNIPELVQIFQGGTSSSSWGCELKLLFRSLAFPPFKVILLVRMWVEILLLKQHLSILTSSSSWGCELK